MSTIVGTTELAEHLGVAVSTVESLAKRRILRRLGRGRWDQDRNRLDYIAHLREQAAGRIGSGGANLAEERARLARAQAEKVELDLREKRGELVSTREVEQEYFALLREHRNALLSIPGRVAADAHSASSLQACERILRDAIHETLERLTEDAEAGPQDTNGGDPGKETNR